MRRDSKWMCAPLLGAFIVACSGLADPNDTGKAPAQGGSMMGLDTDEDERDPPPPPPAGFACVAAGQTFPDGSSVPSGDSCNRCACYDGNVLCSRAVCAAVTCSETVEASDGVCSRFSLDPCRSRDPDCVPTPRSCQAAGQTFPDGAVVPAGDSCNSCTCDDGDVVCTEIACEPVGCDDFLEASDGVCSRFPLDPCITQDPDCGSGAGASCEAAGQIFPDGAAVPSGDACNSCRCDDGSVACTEIACEPVACDRFLEATDGVCSRFPLDPCIFQDPDCGAGAEPGSCEAAGQSFPNGSEVPSGDSCNGCTCTDGSVVCTEIACEPVFCALFVEESDGICSRFPLDPCISQDPDCGSGVGSCEAAGQSFPNGSEIPSGDSCNTCGCNAGNVICTDAACEPVECALFVEESDGVCTRFPLDPCSSQDPDCNT